MTVEQPFPWPRTNPMAPPARYAALRGASPVARASFANGRNVWLITRHEHVRRILTDPRASSEHSHPGFPPIFPTAKHRAEGGEPTRLSYSGMDRPEHATHRRMVNGDFASRRIAEFRPTIQRIVDDHVTAMVAESAADLVRALAEPVPARVIAELLGVPHEVRPTLAELSRIVLSHDGGQERIQAASVRLRRLITELVAANESGPGDGLLRRLIRRYQAAGRYDRRQLVELAGTLITAGHETTANMISLGVLTLLAHPEALARLAEDPAAIPRAIEELLRYLSIADLVTARVAVASIPIGGATIPAGDGIIALTAAANHDPSAFEQPQVFNIHRDATHHVAFGHGIHKCLGEHLARLELEVVLTTIITRLPTLRLATGMAHLRVRPGAVLQGIESLPVTW